MELPSWFKILNLEDTLFEKSEYASVDDRKRFRLKDIEILRKILPRTYVAAADEVKEHNTYNELSGEKVKVGKFLGSIPLTDVGLNPELGFDKKAQDKYWKEHPEFKRQ